MVILDSRGNDLYVKESAARFTKIGAPYNICLQEALVDGYTNTECLQMLNSDQSATPVTVTSNMLCAGGSKDACQGDSGGNKFITFSHNSLKTRKVQKMEIKHNHTQA